MSTKTKFPELLGKTGDEAKATILAQFPAYQIMILAEGTVS
jgi:hypothetical protein